MKKIALFYAPKGGAVNCMAAMIVDKLGKENVDLMYAPEVNADKILEYDKIIFGNAAIHSGSNLADSDKEWKEFLSNLRKISLKGKKVAVFGLGNHLTYPKHFVDSMGDLVHFLEEREASICGKVSGDDYIFEESKAFHNGMFMGLALDEDNEGDKSEARIDSWLKQLTKEFK